MDSKELRNLHEAYLDVYAPQENIEEGLRSAVKRLLGGGKKEAEAPKPESRGAQLRARYNVGPEGSETSAKRKILNRSRERADSDQEEFGDKPFQKQVAQKSKAAHDRYLKAGYSKYGAGDARGRGNKAAKRAAALNKEELEFIVNALVEEGYDLSEYTWDEMYDICLDEAVKQLDELSVNKMHDYINKAEKDRDRLNKKWTQGTATAKERKKVFDREEGESRASKKIRQKTGKDSFRLNALDKLKSAITKESYDIFDVILEYLVAEGYADTNGSALVIMANMSEEWRQSIVEVKMDPRGRPASGPMNVYANPKGKPDQARLDAIKSYEDEQRKKTPEQRKAEQDAYRERQMNNK